MALIHLRHSITKICFCRIKHCRCCLQHTLWEWDRFLLLDKSMYETFWTWYHLQRLLGPTQFLQDSEWLAQHHLDLPNWFWTTICNIHLWVQVLIVNLVAYNGFCHDLQLVITEDLNIHLEDLGYCANTHQRSLCQADRYIKSLLMPSHSCSSSLHQLLITVSRPTAFCFSTPACSWKRSQSQGWKSLDQEFFHQSYLLATCRGQPFLHSVFQTVPFYTRLHNLLPVSIMFSSYNMRSLQSVLWVRVQIDAQDR